MRRGNHCKNSRTTLSKVILHTASLEEAAKVLGIDPATL
jgi:hypothetical protein